MYSNRKKRFCGQWEKEHRNYKTSQNINLFHLISVTQEVQQNK